MQVTGSAPLYVFFGKKTRFWNQVFQRNEKLTVEVREIVKKMSQQLPETFFGLDVLLATILAKPARHRTSAIETIPFFSLRRVRQDVKFSLK